MRYGYGFEVNEELGIAGHSGGGAGGIASEGAGLAAYIAPTPARSTGPRSFRR